MKVKTKHYLDTYGFDSKLSLMIGGEKMFDVCDND